MMSLSSTQSTTGLCINFSPLLKTPPKAWATLARGTDSSPSNVPLRTDSPVFGSEARSVRRPVGQAVLGKMGAKQVAYVNSLLV